MLRYYYIIFTSLIFEIYYFLKTNYVIRHRYRYTNEQCYKLVRNVIKLIKIQGYIFTRVYGLENLPEEGGYIMYPNHQGKYDALGIMYSHKRRCSFVMDKKKSTAPLTYQIFQLSNSLGMELDNVRQSLGIIREVAERVKEGERFIIFPEGGYAKNRNHIREFKPGCFKSALMAKCPIIPVVLVDSWKVFNYPSLLDVHTQVHYLKPIPYEEYKHMNTREIADLVKSRIETVLAANR